MSCLLYIEYPLNEQVFQIQIGNLNKVQFYALNDESLGKSLKFGLNEHLAN
jgi:hypothetical protein